MKKIFMLILIFIFLPGVLFAAALGVTTDDIVESTGERVITMMDILFFSPNQVVFGWVTIDENDKCHNFVMWLYYVAEDPFSIDTLYIKTDNGTKSFDLDGDEEDYYFDMSKELLEWMVDTKTIKMKLQGAGSRDFVVRDHALKSLKSFEEYLKTKAPTIWEKL